MFGVYLIVPVTLDDLRRPLGGFLGTFSKPIESHHSTFTFLWQDKPYQRHYIIARIDEIVRNIYESASSSIRLICSFGLGWDQGGRVVIVGEGVIEGV